MPSRRQIRIQILSLSQLVKDASDLLQQVQITPPSSLPAGQVQVKAEQIRQGLMRFLPAIENFETRLWKRHLLKGCVHLAAAAAIYAEATRYGVSGSPGHRQTWACVRKRVESARLEFAVAFELLEPDPRGPGGPGQRGKFLAGLHHAANSLLRDARTDARAYGIEFRSLSWVAVAMAGGGGRGCSIWMGVGPQAGSVTAVPPARSVRMLGTTWGPSPRVFLRFNEAGLERLASKSSAAAMLEQLRPSQSADVYADALRSKSKRDATSAENLLHTIFGRTSECVKNESLVVPGSVEDLEIVKHRVFRCESTPDMIHESFRKMISEVGTETGKATIELVSQVARRMSWMTGKLNFVKRIKENNCEVAEAAPMAFLNASVQNRPCVVLSGNGVLASRLLGDERSTRPVLSALPIIPNARCGEGERRCGEMEVWALSSCGGTGWPPQHIDKTSREQFEIRTHKWFIDQGYRYPSGIASTLIIPAKATSLGHVLVDGIVEGVQERKARSWCAASIPRAWTAGTATTKWIPGNGTLASVSVAHPADDRANSRCARARLRVSRLASERIRRAPKVAGLAREGVYG